jgi:hypothetical protein
MDKIKHPGCELGILLTVTSEESKTVSLLWLTTNHAECHAGRAIDSF